MKFIQCINVGNYPDTIQPNGYAIVDYEIDFDKEIGKMNKCMFIRTFGKGKLRIMRIKGTVVEE